MFDYGNELMKLNIEERRPSISIIVPVFNVEKYLSQCLESLKNQTLNNIEIILIDDGATDKSGIICDDYAEIDRRFKVIHKKNGGLSSARNAGLGIAIGDYIMFVDSDDWVDTKFCESPYKTAIDTGADIVVFLRSWDRNGILKNQSVFPYEGKYLEKDLLTTFWPITGVVVWNKLYKRSIFEKLRFPDGRLSEDTALTHKLIHKANQVWVINQYLYYHRLARPGSIMTEKTIKLINDEQFFNLKRISDLQRWSYVCKADVSRQALLYLMTLGENAELSDKCKSILNQYTKVSGSYKIRFLMHIYRISPKLFNQICILTGKRIKNG